jgi:Ca2+-binding RTX toxin-like protein
LLKGGDDQVRANTYGADRDVIKGQDGFDLIYVNDEDTLDRIYGGKGNDKCYVNARSEVVSGCSDIIVRR